MEQKEADVAMEENTTHCTESIRTSSGGVQAAAVPPTGNTTAEVAELGLQSEFQHNIQRDRWRRLFKQDH